MSGGFALTLLILSGFTVALPIYVSSSHDRDMETPTMSLFAKAQANLVLTPAERAILRLLEGLACAAAVAVFPLVADALSSHVAVDWAGIARNSLAAAAVAVLLAIVKFCKAHMDNPVAPLAAQEAQSLADQLSAANGLNEAVEEVAVNQALDAVGPALASAVAPVAQ